MKTLIALAALTLVLIPATRASESGTRETEQTAAGYGYPVKPFDEPHPIRGNFGDPRMLFAGPPTLDTVMHGAVHASFHTGVDISAPNGTAVYPVRSGVVRSVQRECVTVDSGGGEVFEYWHIGPLVRVGEQVVGRQTVLGRIMRPQGHVHLTQIENGRKVNPLAPGRLGPYTDTTTPQVSSIVFRSGSRMLLPNVIRGRVDVVAAASDMPTIPAPAPWRGMPTTPALLTWHVETAATGRIAIAERVAYDVRSTEPTDGEFWSVYARGTFQNMAVFGKHYSYMQPGQFLFRLSPNGFDTRALRDDVYAIVVTATDIRGNTSSMTQRFTVTNHRR